jgi:hypothetical protein
MSKSQRFMFSIPLDRDPVDLAERILVILKDRESDEPHHMLIDTFGVAPLPAATASLFFGDHPAPAVTIDSCWGVIPAVVPLCWRPGIELRAERADDGDEATHIAIGGVCCWGTDEDWPNFS